MKRHRAVSVERFETVPWITWNCEEASSKNDVQDKFEEQRKVDLDAKRNEIKTPPIAAINYNYVGGAHTRP